MVGAVEPNRRPLLQGWLGLTSLAVAVALAFGIPHFAYDDCRCDITKLQRERLRSQASHRLELPTLRLQVVNATAATVDPDAAHGTVAIRGPFGIRTGQVAFAATGEEEVNRSLLKEASAWGLLLVSIATTGGWAIAAAVRS